MQSNSERIVELSEMSQDNMKAYYGVIGLNSTFFNQGNYTQSLAYAKKGLALSEQIVQPDFRLLSHAQIGESQIALGNLIEGQKYLNLVLKEYQVEKHEFLGRLGFGDLKYYAQMWSVLTSTWLGYPDRAKKMIVDMQVDLSEQKNIVDIFRIGMARLFYFCSLNEWTEAQATVTPVFAIIEESGEPAPDAFRKLVDYIISANSGVTESIEKAFDEINDMTAQNNRSLQTFFFSFLAEACLKENLIQKGLEYIAKTLDLIEQTGEKVFLSKLYQLQGELLLKRGNASESEQAYLHTIQVAQKQSAKWGELKAAKSLARLWQSQGKKREAFEMLNSVYSWFKEGFDANDMREAKTLLEELSSVR